MSTEIAIFDYLKGEQFTEKLKEINNVSSLGELALVYNVPKTTFSTWNTHNRNSHELVVRTHLRTGVPIHELILPAEFPMSQLHESFSASKEAAMDSYCDSKTVDNPHNQTVVLESFYLKNGQLIAAGEVPYLSRRIAKYGLLNTEVVEVETNEAIYLIDKDNTDAVSGKYLIDVDGRFSINSLQRLPGKRIALALGDSTIEVAEEDIVVVGRVVSALHTN